MNFCPNCGAPLHEQTAAPVSEAPATPAETVQAAEPAANAPAVSGTPGTGTLEYSFGNGEGIVVLEDSYITVRLMRFYEQEVNWGSGPTIEKNVEFKIRNNSSSEYILNFQDAYIGEDGVQVSMYTGNTGPVPGKSNVYQYRISRQTSQNGDPLDSLDQLYALEGTFALSIYSADKSQINDRHEVGMKLQDIFSGAVVPAPVAPAAPVQDQSQEIEAALQGVWMLGADNSFTFQNGSISIVGGGGVLNGSYTVNTGDSMIDATVQASNGTVIIHLPYIYSNGTLSLYNNRNVQLTKQG